MGRLEKIQMISLKDMMRTGQVHRWQIVRTLRGQTLAEHSYMVTMITLHLREEIEPYVNNDDLGRLDRCAAQLVEYALRHDLAEVMVGDIPTPVKVRLRALVEYDPIKAIEGAVDPETRALRHFLDNSCPMALYLVGLSDVIEPMVFLTHEGVNAHAGAVIEKLREKLHGDIKEGMVNWPEVPWDEIVSGTVELMTNGPDGVLSAEKET
jgi:5'-deoxynucleotidase